MLSPSYIILRIQRLEENSVDLDEVAHYEPPQQDLRCLQIQLFSLPALIELTLKKIIIKTAKFSNSTDPDEVAHYKILYSLKSQYHTAGTKQFLNFADVNFVICFFDILMVKKQTMQLFFWIKPKF